MAEMSFVQQDVSDPFAADYESFSRLIEDASKTDPRVVSVAWTNLIKLTEKYQKCLGEIFSVLNDSVGSFSQTLNSSSQGGGLHFFESIEERMRYLNTLKKLVSLNYSYVEYYENSLSSKGIDNSFSGDNPRDKRKKQRLDHDVPQRDYDKHKTRVVNNLLQIIVKPLNKVADSSTEAKEIVGQVARLAYKMIENSSTNSLTRSKELLDMVFSIIGHGVEKYNQSLSFCLRLIQMLQFKEQLAPLLADLVAFIVNRHRQGLLIGEILREIDRIDIRELSRDSSCPRAVSTFLTCLSEKCSPEFITSIEHIFGYLEQDSYIMRNASLSVMANIITIHLHDDKTQEVPEELKPIRDEMMDAMLAHIKDVIGYTRSRALGTWLLLCEKGCIPLSYITPVTRAAVGRLSDKSCFVRRSAAKFVVSILLRNPYASRLPYDILTTRFEEERKILEDMLREEKLRIEKNEEQLETLSQVSSQDESITDETDPEKIHPVAAMKNLVLTEETVVAVQRKKMAFLQGTIDFTKEILRAIPHMVDMLTSKNVTDIQEAIDFFVCCNELHISEAAVGFKRMILLMNLNEKSITDTVLAAYKKIFFDPSFNDTKVVSKLIEFVQSASIAECLSLEILIGQFVASKDLNEMMKRELWAIFTRKKSTSIGDDFIAAIQIIGMLAKVQPEIIQHNLPLCAQYGLTLTSFGEEDCRRARETCIAMRKSLPRKLEDKQRRPFMRLARDDELFLKLEDILVESVSQVAFEHWFSFCDEALKVIFEMAENPEKICESLFARLSDEILKNSVPCNSVSSQQENVNRNDSPDYNPTMVTTQTNGTTTSSQAASHAAPSHNLELVHPMALARFIHFLGATALNMAVYLEHHVLIEIKTRSAMASDEASNNNKSVNNISVNNISMSSRRRSKRFGGNKSADDENLEEEIGLAGAEAEDIEMEFIGNVCDDEIVCGNNMLAKSARLVIEVVTDPNRFPYRELKLASSLALAKFMAVSVRFCSSYLRLLFTILERSTDKEVKINLLMAMSDLCVRFPNQLDGWTGKIFDCLKSDDTLVKRAALKIVSRLVLCDVIKAKEQISAIANLIVDDDEQISTYSRHFFLELSKKLNAIYNVLPDIISRLSNSASEPNFRLVMKFIFELIDKSHHVDRLIDKLCTRFLETDNERQWADLAYCLSLLKYTDKSMCKLIDKFDCYKDKLCIDSVREAITTTVATYRRTLQLKNEMKQHLDEFEVKLAQVTGNTQEGAGEEGADDGEQQANGSKSNSVENETEGAMDVDGQTTQATESESQVVGDATS